MSGNGRHRLLRQTDLLELLAAHADALNLGADNFTPYRFDYAESGAAVRPLLNLAASLKSALAPIRPRPAFKARLARQLSEHEPATVKTPRRPSWRRAAVFGSVLSLLGLALLFLRYSRSQSNPSVPATA
jgi:hypothetical protein